MTAQMPLFTLNERKYRKGYAVEAVNRQECEPFILKIHYAKRWPSVSYRFGLFYSDELVGVVTYGTPSSSTLRSGIAGERYKNDVLELNRLGLKYNRSNEASVLVGRSIKLLPRNKIIVSFADTSQGHVGYVYQATNFFYTGLSAKRTNWVVKGKEHLHGQSIADEFRNRRSKQPTLWGDEVTKGRAALMREKYGEDFTLNDRPRKHRYIYFHGGKKWKKDVIKNLNYSLDNYTKQQQSKGYKYG